MGVNGYLNIIIWHMLQERFLAIHVPTIFFGSSFGTMFLLYVLSFFIWYQEPRLESMGKSKASITVTDEELDREFQQQQMFSQIQEFHESMLMMNIRHDDLQHKIAEIQHSLVDLSVHRVHQEQIQQTLLKQLCSVKTQPPPQPTSQIPIGSIPISLDFTPFSALHTIVPHPNPSPLPIPLAHAYLPA